MTRPFLLTTSFILALLLGAGGGAGCASGEAARQPVDERPAEQILSDNAPQAPAGDVAAPEASTPAVADTVNAAAADARPARRRGAPHILEIYGPREIRVGETPTYRVRLAPGAVLPVQYFWDFGEGTASIGSTVTPGFPSEGHYEIRAIARNSVGRDTAFVRIAVQPPIRAPLAEGDLPPGTSFAWVVASRLDADEARAVADRFRAEGFEVVVRRHAGQAGEPAAFVAVGTFGNEAEALEARAGIEQEARGPLWLAHIVNQD